MQTRTSDQEEYIQDIIQAIAYFYELTQGRKLNINSLDIAIDYDDTYIEDKQSTAQALRNDALTFDIPRLKIMYFMKQYGFTEEEATELLNEEIQDDGEEDEEE